MGPPERLNLRWGDFEANARLYFMKLRDERQFYDVTVVAECGEKVEANKVVLAGGSSFFHKIRKENPHPHPLIYLKGVSYKHLVYLMDFVYTGQTSIVEDDVNDFLDIAQDLRVNGLTVHGTLETTSNQTASQASLPNTSPRVSHPRSHCVTSAAPAPHQHQVAAEEPGPSLGMLRQSRPQSMTSACPAPHQSQVFNKEAAPPPTLSQLHSAKSALPRGQVASNETLAETSPSISNPHSAKSALPRGQVASNETSPSISNPHSVKSALPRGQVASNETSPSISNPHSAKSGLPRGKLAANETAPSPSISNPQSLKSAPQQYQVVAEHHVQSYRLSHPRSVKPAPHQGQVAAEEAAPSLRTQQPHRAVSSHLNNALSQASCEGGHDNTCNIKVEVGDAEHYNIFYGVNDRGEAYIRQVSLRGLEENGGNINVDEDIVLSAEQDQNGEVISTGKEPKEEILESSNDMVIREVADVGFEDEQMPHDWYEQGEESEIMILGRNKDDTNYMIPDGEQDSADKTKSSEDTDFQCFLCSITFTTSSQLRRHKKSHMEENKFPRPVRSKMSSQMGSSNKKRIDEEEHLKRNHTGDKPYQCLLSSKSKSLRKNKMIHLNRQKMTRTQAKSYQCAQCPKSFSKLCNLKQHTMIHTGEKPYQCAQCPKSFSQLCNLKRHTMIHTREKPYQCAQCPQSFSQPGKLKLHTMIHTGEKPHQCAQCSKSFSQPGNLKVHKMIHTGEKPHQCVVCSRRFSLLATLKKHKRVHTGAVVVLSDEGEAAEFSGSSMGLYLKETDGTFQQAGGDMFLYQDSKGVWYISDTLHEDKGYMKNSTWCESHILPRYGWEFVNDDSDKLVMDDKLKIVDASKMKFCNTITVSSTKYSQKEFLGEFHRVPEIWQNGWPVFKNKNGKKLEVPNDWHAWCIANDLSENAFSSGRLTSCPAHPMSGISERHGYEFWQYWKDNNDDDSGWSEDETFNIKCDVHG